VPMAGWQRGMVWNETGLPWINPSPNMKDPLAAMLYPGLGILEATNLSVARGTDFPFHRYGAPWIDPVAVLKQLPSLPGFRFTCRDSGSVPPVSPPPPLVTPTAISSATGSRSRSATQQQPIRSWLACTWCRPSTGPIPTNIGPTAASTAWWVTGRLGNG